MQNPRELGYNYLYEAACMSRRQGVPMSTSLKQAQPTTLDPSTRPSLSRRTVFAGAGTVGAMAAAAALLPKTPAPAAALAAAPKAVDATGGYQLTEHIQRYYQTARV
jgi:hypothetical protein